MSDHTYIIEALIQDVVSDPEILSGTLVFKGTRVPIGDVLASLDKGIDLDRIKAAYPTVSTYLLDRVAATHRAARS